MTKKLDRKAARTVAPNEGLFYLSFNFGGKKYSQAFKLTDSELRMLKGMLKEFGEDSVDSIAVKQVFAYAKLKLEGMISQAFKDELDRTHVPKRPNILELPESNQENQT